jgi:membrane protein DedA with SNARE-associated domain
MPWPHFLVMNAFGGICWAALFGGGAWLIGAEMKRVAGPVGFVLLIVAIGLVAVGIFYFRRHEKELERRAEAALPGPWLGTWNRKSS